MKVRHLDYQPGGASRVVFSGNLAWFTGHAAPQFSTLAQQTAGVLRRYDELFAQFGLKKENILYAICFLKNADDEEDFICNSPYSWNEGDLVSIEVAKEDIKLRLKGSLDDYEVED